MVFDFITGKQSLIAPSLLYLYQNLKNLVEQVTIPIDDLKYSLVWNHNANGELSL